MKNNKKYKNRVKSFMRFYKDEFVNRLDAFETQEGLPPENEIPDNTFNFDETPEEE